MKTFRSPGHAAIIASTAAGPAFVLSLAAAWLYLQVPRPIPFEFDPVDLVGSGIGFMVMATIFGFLLALLPNLAGAALMAALAETNEMARDPIAWTAAGLLAGAGIAALTGGFEDNGPTAFAVIATSAICARICRAQLDWEPQA